MKKKTTDLDWVLSVRSVSTTHLSLQDECVHPESLFSTREISKTWKIDFSGIGGNSTPDGRPERWGADGVGVARRRYKKAPYFSSRGVVR